MKAVNEPHLGCCLENYGFSVITFEAKQPALFKIDIYCIENKERHAQILNDDYDDYDTPYIHLKFTDTHHFPIREQHDNPSVEQLRDYVLSACNDYLYLLKSEELEQQYNGLTKRYNSSGVVSYLFYSMNSLWKYMRPNTIKITEMAYADDLIAYFNQPILPSLDILLSYVFTSIEHEKLRTLFMYLYKSSNEKIQDPQIEGSFFFLLFKKLISIPDGMGENIKTRWLSLIDSPTWPQHGSLKFEL